MRASRPRLFLNKIFGGGNKANPAAASLKLDSTVKLRYTHSVARQHMDETAHVAVVVLHDYASNAKAMSGLVSSMVTLPATTGTFPTNPLEIFSADLRNHGGSPKSSTNGLLDHVSDVVRFIDTVALPDCQAVHLVGVGWGAWVAAGAALTHPSSAVSSVAAINAIPMRDDGTRAAAVARLAMMNGLSLDKLGSLKELEGALEAIKSPTERHTAMLSTTMDPKQLHWLGDVHGLQSNMESAFEVPQSLGAANSSIPLTIIQSGEAPSSAQMESITGTFPSAKSVQMEGTGAVLSGQTAQSAVAAALKGAQLLQ